MTQMKKNIVKLILFGVITILLIEIASAMMTPEKWFDEKLIQDRNARSIQLMEEPENTIDILNIGDSLSTAGYSPMELWREQGYTSFNIGADGMRTAEAYYALVEACEKQQPKCLMIESLILFRYAIGQDLQMALSQPLYHAFPFVKYHNIWKYYIEDRGIKIYHKGYLVNEEINDEGAEPEYLDLELGDPNSKMYISAHNRMRFDQIKKYCDDHGIEIVIYSMPSATNYNWERIEKLEAFAKEKGVRTLAIVNVEGSSIAREADFVFYTKAGIEIAVATTKGYTAQLIAMYLIAIQFAMVRGLIDEEKYSYYLRELKKIPAGIRRILEEKERIQWFASKYSSMKDSFFIGRGLDYAICQEGSLKMKEISYVHSEAYAGGELKHGTISLVEDGILVVGVLTQNELFEKTVSNMVAART